MTEVTNAQDSKALTQIQGLTSGSGVMTTASGNTDADRRLVLNALLNSKPLSEHLGEQLDVVDIVAQAVTINDAATDEERTVVRTTLICVNGESYATTSDSIVSSLRDIFAILGQPSDWPGPLGLIVSEERGAKAGRKFYKVSVA